MAQDKDDPDQHNTNTSTAESKRDSTKDHTPTKVYVGIFDVNKLNERIAFITKKKSKCKFKKELA